jgi:hypothetical protein
MDYFKCNQDVYCKTDEVNSSCFSRQGSLIILTINNHSELNGKKRKGVHGKSCF